MCGRYVLFTTEEISEIKEMLREIEERYKNQEVFPTDTAPVIVPHNSGNSGSHATLMIWGFPQYQRSGVVINARSETVTEKPMFRQSVQTRRCVIPSCGFYEWSGKAKAKVKHIFNLPEQKSLYMAGCYNTFRNAAGREEKRFVILTTEANSSVAEIHDRMPVVLLPDEIDDWFYGADFQCYFDRSHIRLIREYADNTLPKV